MGFFKRLIFSVLGNGGIFWLLDTVIFRENFVVSGHYLGYLVLAVIFCLLNLLVKPIIVIITFPIRLLTLGLISFVINAIMLWLLETSVNIVEVMGAHIEIKTVFSYFVVGTVLAIFHAVLMWFEK